MTPRASIIITVYNGKELLEKAVRSVMAQTEKDIEIIVVDDASPDGSAELITQLAAEDNRIRAVLNKTNIGFSPGVNRAMREARGKWIALLDYDDWYAPERIKTLLDAAESHGTDIHMVTDNQVLYDTAADMHAGLALKSAGKDKIIDLDEYLIGTDPTALFDYGQLKPIYRADFIRENNVFYPEDGCYCSDYVALLDFFAGGGKALLVDKALYYYVQPYGSVSRQWAQQGRRRYPFAAFKRQNDEFIQKYANHMSKAQLGMLKKRSAGFAALERMHLIREHGSRQHYAKACMLMMTTTSPIFWKLIMKRSLARLKRMHTPLHYWRDLHVKTASAYIYMPQALPPL